MIRVFLDLEKRQELFKTRLFLFGAFICCVIFAVLMFNVYTPYKDFYPARIFVSILSVAGLIVTYYEGPSTKYAGIILRVIALTFLFLHLYILVANDWAMFHRWSYFVTVAILCSIAMSLRDYLLYCIPALIMPMFFSMSAPITIFELFHFHTANLVMTTLIGVSIHSHLHYKKQVKKLTNDLIDQSKMAALGEMSGGISHEINNPLTIIKGSISQLKRIPQQSPEDHEKFNEHAQKIVRSVDRITKITTGLREFSQENKHQNLELHDLNEIIQDGIILTLRKFKNMDIDISYTPVQGEALCLCKKNLLTQIILNLCSNACEATRASVEPAIGVDLDHDGKDYLITITDNGKGIDEENAPKIMEPFFTTKEIGKGLGLGLSISHGFAKIHGGELLYEPDVGETRFVLKLPIPKNEPIRL